MRDICNHTQFSISEEKRNGRQLFDGHFIKGILLVIEGSVNYQTLPFFVINIAYSTKKNKM